MLTDSEAKNSTALEAADALPGLMLDARGLYFQSHRIAMLCLAAALLPDDRSANTREIKKTLTDFTASCQSLRKMHLNAGFDQASAKGMGDVFSSETEGVFECFEVMTRNICAALTGSTDPCPRELGELVRLVQQELFDAIGAVVSATQTAAALEMPLPISTVTPVSEGVAFQNLLGGQDVFASSEELSDHHLIKKDRLIAQIKDGLGSDQFDPYFQPQVEARSGKIVGVEVLARWHHPQRGLLTPFHFLDAAQDARLLDDLDRLLMESAFETMVEWIGTGLNIPQISVNLTASRLLETDLVDSVSRAASNAKLAPSRIGLEILESAMIDTNSRQMIANIEGLSDAGFKVELDDFGTGHASISNLKNFKVDRIKIDRSFVKDVHISADLAKITSAMIGLAHSLRVDALAEGVESPEERLVLNALGCDHIQGFGVSRPLPRSEIPKWFAESQSPKQLPSRRR